MTTARNALANFLGFDWSEMPDYRYQSTRTKTPVYTVDGDYYTAVKAGTGIWKSDRYEWAKVATVETFDIYEHKTL
jgi:hypothetical protein